MIREVSFDKEVREGQLKGAEIVFRAVKSTMGAKGGLVSIQNRYDESYLSKDGHYTAQTIFLEDPLQNMGAQMIKEVAQISADGVGDGTTTSTVLAYNMFKLGMKGLASEYNAIDIKIGMDKAVNKAVKELAKNAVKIDNTDFKSIQQVATVSANNRKDIGELITKAAKGIKEEGAIITQDAKGNESSVEITEGLVVERSYVSPYFVTDPIKMVAEYEDSYIMLLDETISTLKEIVPILKYVIEKDKSLLIIANDVEQEALATLVKNKMEKGLKVIAVRTPGVGMSRTTWLEDIAAATGSTVISGIKGTNAENFVPEMLGTAKKVRVDRDRTIIVGGGALKEDLKNRIDTIKNMITQEKQKGALSFFKERLAKLDGGIAVIHVGSTTEVELKEKKDLFEDAIAAIRSATEEGVIAGGGSSLAHASKALSKLKGKNEDEKFGIKVVQDAMKEPLKVIMDNAGLGELNILGEVLKSDNVNFGYNLNEYKYCDMVEMGILDTVKVERLALENSCSVASMMLMTGVAINPVVEHKKD